MVYSLRYHPPPLPSLMTPDSTTILIVGAGPTGLACAISLVTNGVNPQDIAIIDAQAQGLNLSRAIAIHAKTVEELETLGCSEKLLSQGIFNHVMRFCAGRTVLLTADFPTLAARTRYPFTLTIAQTDTERVLEERLLELGVSVHRPLRLVDLKGISDGIEVTFEGGRTMKTKFLIGADGSRSMVRSLSGILYRDPISGEDPYNDAARARSHQEKPLALGDVHFSGDVPSSLSNRVYLGPRGLLLVVRLPDKPNSKPIYRLGCTVEPGTKDVSKEMLQDGLRVGLELSEHDTPKIESVMTASAFHVRYALADQFYRSLGGGAVVLVGDAAHIHSPAGGQGMNLGIRDSIQLGRVLANVIPETKSNDTIPAVALEALERYSVERRPLALQVIKMTKTLTRIVLIENTFIRTVRNIVLWALGRIPSSGKALALKLSGL
ncbi:hypothetical protein QCA50_013588 [Cerrena zonata]|uniref:FAD-binding domain-containing protein n=1 Tax=Cerrena zonata TaxID=2478898 RepID=A0AAW0G116_9APHY